MIDCDLDGDAAALMLERRWFGAMRAVSELRTECETLADAMTKAESAWWCTRVRLAEMQAICDALGDQLTRIDKAAAPPAQLAVASAA